MSAPPVTNKERARMREMRHQGMSVNAIGAELGRTGPCVWNHVSDIAVHAKPGRVGMGEAVYARMLAARESGANRHEIAARFGVAPGSVNTMLSHYRKMLRRASA